METFKTTSLTKQLEKEREQKKKLLSEIKRVKGEIVRFSKKKLRKAEEKTLKKIERTRKKIEEIEKKEKEVKLEKGKVEEAEEAEQNLIEKRRVEKIRWRVEKKERVFERKKWMLEDKLEKYTTELKSIQRGLEKGNLLEKKLKELDTLLKEKGEEIHKLREKIEEQRKLEENFKKAWKEFLSGNIDSALEELEKIQKEIGKKSKKEKKESFLKNKGKKEFFEPLEYYQKGQIPQALNSLGKILREAKTQEGKIKEHLPKEKIKPEEEIKKGPEENLPTVIIEERKVLEKKNTLEKKDMLEKKIAPEKEVLSQKKAIEDFKKKLEEEKGELIEEERRKLKELREEFEKKQKEMLRANLKEKSLNKDSISEKRRLRESQEELLRRELEIERRVQERLRARKEELLKKRDVLSQAEKSLLEGELTEEERKKREEIIKHLRERIEEEKKKLENKELTEIKEGEVARQRKIKVLENIFDQALSLYNEKEFKKAKKIFSIIKEQLEQGKKLGLFVNLNNIPIYTKAVYFTRKIDEENKTKQEETPREKKGARIITKPRKTSYYSKKIFRSLKEFFFHPSIVGLDISDFSLELIYLNKRGRILSFSRQVLKPGILINGNVKNPKLFSQSIKDLLKKAHFPPFQPRRGPVVRAIISLPNSAIYTLIFNAGATDNLFKEVKRKLEKTLPLPLEKVYWDYIAYKKNDIGRNKIICAAGERDIIDTLVYSLRANGINPIALDISALSIKRALSPSPIKETTGITDIGAYTTTFNIFDTKGVLDFSTTIPYGTFNFPLKIAHFLKISEKEARIKLAQEGLKNIQIKEIIKEDINKIIREINGAMIYYQEVSGVETRAIFLTGGGALIPGIIDFLRKSFPNRKIEAENPFFKMKKEKLSQLKDSSLFVGALGAALRAIHKNPIKGGINLLPEELKKEEKKNLLSFFVIKIKPKK